MGFFLQVAEIAVHTRFVTIISCLGLQLTGLGVVKTLLRTN